MLIQGKLVKLFSVQLNNRQKNPGRFDSSKLKNTPSLKQWLEVVGLSILSVQVCLKLSINVKINFAHNLEYFFFFREYVKVSFL